MASFSLFTRLLLYLFLFIAFLFNVNFVFARVQVIDLGTLGGNYSKANAINNHGQITGVSKTASGAEHAFLWENGKMTDLGILGVTDYFSPGAARLIEYSEGMDINDNGEIVGHTSYDHYSYYQMNDIYTVFLWKDGEMRDIGPIAGGLLNPMSINNNTTIVGMKNGFKSTSRNTAYRWLKNVGAGDLSGLNEIDSGAFAVNDKGQIVACNYDLSVHNWRLVLWDDGQITTILTDTGICLHSPLTDINDKTQIVWGERLWENGQITEIPIDGNAVNNQTHVAGQGVAENGETHAFIWKNGEVIDLGTLGGNFSIAYDLNENGQVVGESKTENGETRATLWIVTEMPTPPSVPTPPSAPTPPTAPTPPSTPETPTAPVRPTPPSRSYR